MTVSPEAGRQAAGDFIRSSREISGLTWQQAKRKRDQDRRGFLQWSEELLANHGSVIESQEGTTVTRTEPPVVVFERDISYNLHIRRRELNYSGDNSIERLTAIVVSPSEGGDETVLFYADQDLRREDPATQDLPPYNYPNSTLIRNSDGHSASDREVEQAHAVAVFMAQELGRRQS